jgi:hypothetical protein
MPQADTTFRWLFHVNTWPEIGHPCLVAERVNERNSVVGRVEYGVCRTSPWGTEHWGLIKWAGGTRLSYAGEDWGRNQDGWDGAVDSCIKQIDAALGFWDARVADNSVPSFNSRRAVYPPVPEDERTICANCERTWGQHYGWYCSPYGEQTSQWEEYLPPQPVAAPRTEASEVFWTSIIPDLMGNRSNGRHA